jgi:hypothetical protein
MRISNNMAQHIRDEASTMEVKGDAIIIQALKIPRGIFQQDARAVRDYKEDIQQQLLEDHRIYSVFVLWTVDGDCVLERAV